MKRKLFFRTMLTATLLFCTLLDTACVNHIEEEDDEIREGKTPITFSVKVTKMTPKAINNQFEKGDEVGLFAMLAGETIDQRRYIDNLDLTCGANSTLIPSKSIFYPEGDNIALDFISYYPYNPQGAAPESTEISVSVQKDQSNKEKYSQSDFLVAKIENKASSAEAVELAYKHKLAKIKITLTPGEGEDIDQMLKDNPQIIASGFCTHATYNLKDGVFSDISEAADIITSGTWIKNSDKLIGKEFIIIPQVTDGTQELQMEWNGRIYSCPMPKLDTADGNTQYEIKITSMQTDSNILNGIVGSIEEWNPESPVEDTNNDGNYTAVHIPALSFLQSNVYRIYTNGKPIAEICKEYLLSEKYASKAIVTYPVKEDGDTDISKGTVLHFLDIDKPINGGSIGWDKTTETFNYTSGNSPAIEKVYFDKNGNPLTEKQEAAVDVNVLKLVIKDTRSGLQEYPIVKIGTQYWMRKDLCATTYQDGTAIEQQSSLGKGAGYFKPVNQNTYFYNGEAVINKKLSPADWRIPSEEDWNILQAYLKGKASLVKAGKWESSKPNLEVTPAENLTELDILPVGSWSGTELIYLNKMVGYWTLDAEYNIIPDQTISFTGENSEFHRIKTKTGVDPGYYKALSIRCIKE